MIFEIKDGNFKYVSEPSIEQIKWGKNDDPRGLLKLNKIYKGKKEVHSNYTAIFLDEFPDKKFNSVNFCEVTQDE